MLPIKSPLPDKKSPLPAFLIQFFFVAIVFLVIGFSLGKRNAQITNRGLIPKIIVTNQQSPQNQQLDFSLFWRVLETLPEKYLDKGAIDSQKLLYGAISGMVRSLGDPYTVFLDPKQNESIKSELSGSFEGVGIQIGFDKDKRLVVIAPLGGTPASKAGIRARDLILKIDDKGTFDMTLPEAVDLIRGPAGTQVKLVLQHALETNTYERVVERARINVSSVEVEFKGDSGNIAHLKVSRFGEKTEAEWGEAVASVLSRKAKGIIVDVRNNPGGFLTGAIHLSSEFIKGTVVKQEFADGRIQSVGVDHKGKLLRVPLVVLVNGGSASASEIFAGAIQDNNRGKVVGEVTFGKGTVQDVVDYPGGAGLHVTIAKWLTPKGKSINGDGITPDVIIKAQEDQTDTESDPQLEKALELLK